MSAPVIIVQPWTARRRPNLDGPETRRPAPPMVLAMRIFLTVLALAGGVLPVTAVMWGWLNIRAEYRSLVHDLEAIDEIIAAPDGLTDSKDTAMLAIRRPKFNVGRLTYTHEWARRLILEQAMDDLRGPAWLAGTGVVLASISSMWSLWL